MTAPFSDEMTLVEARTELLHRIPEGERCPVCTQFAKMYRRKVNSSMAAGLIEMYKAFGTELGYLQDVRRKTKATDNREESKLRYWGLVVEDDSRRSDGGRTGWWRVTPKGEQWVLGTSTVPKYAHLYDGECLGLGGDQVTIMDALGQKFDYHDLMKGV